MAADRESTVYMATLAQQSERFDEMVEYMKVVAKMPEELTEEERNLLSVAYKNVVSFRIMRSLYMHRLSPHCHCL